jgi:acetyl-CoA acetyltransferase
LHEFVNQVIAAMRGQRCPHHDDARQRSRTARQAVRLQTMCEGGGMANATIIERLD